MQRRNRWIVLAGALIAAMFLMVACGQASSSTAKKESPATLEKGDNGINRVTLTEKAAERLAIQTTQVREEQVGGAQRKVIPYAAVIYDLQGKTWTYTSPARLTFVREAITVDHIDGDRVVLSEGPATGTEVVTVGVAELYGTDTGIGK
ncbi:MAG TPA: hypothetical protein VFX76_14685 [Roseiflexaceae bacterium]|nr:hypothetical protein [Roseiflexaceae bacterium]